MHQNLNLEMLSFYALLRVVLPRPTVRVVGESDTTMMLLTRELVGERPEGNSLGRRRENTPTWELLLADPGTSLRVNTAVPVCAGGGRSNIYCSYRYDEDSV
jgi:hypothetical protein